MKKPSLLYASPFPPQRSGISDYSVTLVTELKKLFKVTILTDDYKLSDGTFRKGLPLLRFGRDKINYNKFDHKIYNIGNNPDFHSNIYRAALKHPGLVILHDFILYYLVVGTYRDHNLYGKLYEIGGARAVKKIKPFVKNGHDLLDCKKIAADLPLNRELLVSENKIMVHSNYARTLAIKSGATKENVYQVNLVGETPDSPPVNQNKLYKKYSIPEGVLLICSFGFIAETKMNKLIARTVNQLNKKRETPACYVMVGEGNDADHELGPYVIKTGFTEFDDFISFMYYANLVINLRHPSMGETSAALIQAMMTGAPCLVSNDAWFSELPDDVVFKINNPLDIDYFEKTLEQLLNTPDRLATAGEKATEYAVQNHTAQKIAGQIKTALENSCS